MGLEKILAGSSGRKLKHYEQISQLVNTFEPETEDVSAQESVQRDALLERWRTWRAEAGEDRLGALDPATEQALRALGYLR